MASKLTLDDLYNMVANKVGNHATPLSAKKYFRAMYRVILEQLELNGKITIPTFGTFELRDRKSGERRMGNPNEVGTTQLVYVPPKIDISFKSSEIFDRSVNELDFGMARKRTTKKYIAKNPTKNVGIEQSVVNMLNKGNKRSKNNGKD